MQSYEALWPLACEGWESIGLTTSSAVAVVGYNHTSTSWSAPLPDQRLSQGWKALLGTLALSKKGSSTLYNYCSNRMGPDNNPFQQRCKRINANGAFQGAKGRVEHYTG